MESKKIILDRHRDELYSTYTGVWRYYPKQHILGITADELRIIADELDQLNSIEKDPERLEK